MKQKPFYVSISMLSVFLFLLAAVSMLFSGMEVHKVNESVQKEIQIQNNRRDCEAQGEAFSDGSDYLTDEVWRFIATGDREHMNHYWTEVHWTQSREKAIEKLRLLSPSQEELALFKKAKDTSDNLISGETWAMRMAAESLGLDISTLPVEVAAVELTPEELALSPEQQQQMAMEYIFGMDYKDAKTRIANDLLAFQEKLHTRKNAELEETKNKTHARLDMALGLNVVMLLILLLSMVAVYGMVTRPFKNYARALRKMEETGFAPLKESGSRDTIRFAQTFNRIYSDWKEQRERLEEERFRFRVAVENTSVIIYEYRPDIDEYKAYGLLDGKCDANHSVPIERVFSDFLYSRAAAIVGKSGAEVLQKLVDEKGGTEELPILFNGVTIWGRITATAIYDENNRFVKLIGKIMNIESEREKEIALEEIRSRDPLTGIYNKETGVRAAQAYMQKKPADEICTMMLLDMDDFRQINQSEGATFADAVLMEAADILRTVSSSDDLAIRLGGDEFMLLIKDCPKARSVVLGQQIAAAIRNLSPQDNTELSISASIGMCSTEVVDEYSGLYRCAESTLKYVKDHTKGQAACYLDTSNELGTMLTQMYPGRHSINQIDRTGGASKEDLLSFALDLLGKSKNLDDALFLLLSRVGKRYDLDRISIIEVDAEYLICRITHQWTKNPADNQIGEIHYVSAEELHKVTESYDEDGLCEAFGVADLHGLGSILHAAIWNRGAYDGIMAFESKKADYAWTEEERQMLSELIKIISSFTLKARADAISQAKTEFLSRMSHEIRTPMNAITGMTTIAKASLGNTDKTLDCLNKIESANAYLLNLINDILDMSRIESGKMEIHPTAVAPARELENLDMMMRPQAEEKGLKFIIENACSRTCWIYADNLRINQVLINLLGNAVKFTAAGGSVTLRVETVEETDKEIVLRFCVSDTGIGIDEEAQKRVFNAFEQASSNVASSYGGTGLGLAISNRLVQMMGGALEVNSAPGKGSSFFFTLRFAHAEADAAEKGRREPLQKAKPYSMLGKRVLLAEDNELNREIAQEILSMHGFSVEAAADGSQAVALFQTNPPDYYDAVLMDIRMPVMDGFEATRKIRTMGKNDSRTIPIIAMTANAFDEDMRQSLESGMNGHLSKPIEVEKLLDMLETCMKKAKT